jgi:GT2 family glycosyltransferase
MVMTTDRLPITIVIATYNRRDDLVATLAALERLEPVAEVLVVDNASTDGTVEAVGQGFPSVRLVPLDSNRGVPAFGVGVTASTQPYVFFLDDDATPAPGTLAAVVARLEAEPEVAVIACHIIDRHGDPVTLAWPRHPLCFWGCGAGLRRQALANQPYVFDPRLLLHGTEMDLAVRLYASGYAVEYLPQAVVHHRVSSTNRSTARRIYFLTQSAAWFPIKHLPMRFAVPAVARHLATLLYRSVEKGCLRAWAMGLIDAVRQLPGVLGERAPVPEDVARIYYENVWEYEPLTDKLRCAIWRSPRSRQEAPGGFPAPFPRRPA